MINENELSRFVQSLHELLEQLDELQLTVAAVKIAEAIDILKLSTEQNISGGSE